MKYRNRSRVEIMVEMLIAINMDRQYGASAGKLMTRVQTSYESVKKYLAELKGAGLVEYHSAENLYTVTERGRRLITLWSHVVQMLTPPVQEEQK